MTKIYETKVVGVGPEAAGMIENANMLILFGSGAPADLAEFCFTIEKNPLEGTVEVGGKLLIDSTEFEITAVGNVVQTNLGQLGHITISFDGSAEGSLPGTLHVKGDVLPTLNEGSVLQILSA